MSPAAAHSRDRWLIRATGAAVARFHMHSRQAQFFATGWNPLAFKTAAAEGDDMKLMSALAAIGALLVATIPAAIKVVF